jgi:hypothetical protein
VFFAAENFATRGKGIEARKRRSEEERKKKSV